MKGDLERIAKAYPDRYRIVNSELYDSFSDNYFSSVVGGFSKWVVLALEFDLYDLAKYKGNLAERIIKALADKLEKVTCG